MKNSKLLTWAVVDALGALLYIAGVAWLMSNEKNILPGHNFLAPVAMLSLFVLSALITSLVILGRPIYFYFEGRKSDAVKLLVYTAVSFAVFTAAVFLILAIF